jgi:hypothetical protein
MTALPFCRAPDFGIKVKRSAAWGQAAYNFAFWFWNQGEAWTAWTKSAWCSQIYFASSFLELRRSTSGGKSGGDRRTPRRFARHFAKLMFALALMGVARRSSAPPFRPALFILCPISIA